MSELGSQAAHDRAHVQPQTVPCRRTGLARPCSGRVQGHHVPTRCSKGPRCPWGARSYLDRRGKEGGGLRKSRAETQGSNGQVWRRESNPIRGPGPASERPGHPGSSGLRPLPGRGHWHGRLQDPGQRGVLQSRRGGRRGPRRQDAFPRASLDSKDQGTRDQARRGSAPLALRPYPHSIPRGSVVFPALPRGP